MEVHSSSLPHTTMTPEFTEAATLMTTQLVNEAVTRLATKYGFDVDDALAFLHGKEEPPIDPTDLPTGLLSCASFAQTKAFSQMKKKETQKKYYKRMKASPEMVEMAEMESKLFGSVSETAMCEIFGLGPRTSTQNDATLNGKKIEIKSARYLAGKNDCMWQHLEPDHDYEYALFVLLDFHQWKVWGIKKTLLMGEMRDKGIVARQGEQGWWTHKSKIEPYLTPITTREELLAFLQ